MIGREGIFPYSIMEENENICKNFGKMNAEIFHIMYKRTKYSGNGKREKQKNDDII